MLVMTCFNPVDTKKLMKKESAHYQLLWAHTDGNVEDPAYIDIMINKSAIQSVGERNREMMKDIKNYSLEKM